MKNTKLALIYDFDKTLSPKDMQEFHFIQSLGYNNPADFWQECDEFSKNQNRIFCLYFNSDGDFLPDGTV